MKLAPFIHFGGRVLIDIACDDIVNGEMDTVCEALCIRLGEVHIQRTAAVGALGAVNCGDDGRGDSLNPRIQSSIVEIIVGFKHIAHDLKVIVVLRRKLINFVEISD